MAEALGNFRFAGAAAAATLIRMSVPGIDTQIQKNNRSNYVQTEGHVIGFRQSLLCTNVLRFEHSPGSGSLLGG
jgi:hypothetical protein